eukprot:CAMPEP_0175166714 /NCGR_PEP_ID=MMETSP0087-20121206/27872_1 /TAXON_ID=136419 /ORGANISM="Unknown Unknown, Strain D1" /LENGTH=231 /DNA_ID=CAMNT_0016456387 /DNA_START=71 /DNA_END=762 /DNA_ORIENTATION=+
MIAGKKRRKSFTPRKKLATKAARKSAQTKPSQAKPMPDWVTRCPCGKNDDSEGFMIECETCEVWQHGECVGLTEATAPDGAYYCELCAPDHPIHVKYRALLASIQKKGKRKKKSLETKVEVSKKQKNEPAENSDSETDQAPQSSNRSWSGSSIDSSRGSANINPETGAPLSREERKLKQLLESFEKLEQRNTPKVKTPRTPKTPNSIAPSMPKDLWGIPDEPSTVVDAADA